MIFIKMKNIQQLSRFSTSTRSLVSRTAIFNAGPYCLNFRISMCLLFLFTNDDESSHCYRLIIANNRDEYWERPTNDLAWSKDGDFLYGEDRLPGGEGGTWLGVARSGKIGVLLNILGVLDKTKKGRGHFIPEFLISNVSSKEFVENRILSCPGDYNPFHLILLDLRLPQVKTITCDVADGDAVLNELDAGVYTCDNASINQSWKKSSENRDRFLNIVNKHPSKDQRDQLCDELLTLLKDRTRYPGDAQLRHQAAMTNIEEDIILERSAPFVFSPKIKYGTRTHSIVTVDFEGNCEFIEKTMKMPIDPNNIEWTTTSKGFKLS